MPARPAAGLLPLALLAALPLPAAAQAPAPAIADNSFLLEEAYNQERGVVQHVNTMLQPVADPSWSYTFTQEWPVPSQRHQVSVTVPVLDAGGSTGFGDVAVHYRYQLLDGSRAGVAVAPRASLLLPTGSVARARGTGGAGAQVNLPVSKRWGGRWVSHSNLGATWIAGASNVFGHEADTRGFNAGQGLVWLARPAFNVLVELAWSRAESVAAPGRVQRTDTLYLSPGVRWAHNFESGLQIVPGVAVPIGLGPSRGDEGVFLYLSLEHPFRR
jgi:hypothetical protein